MTLPKAHKIATGLTIEDIVDVTKRLAKEKKVLTMEEFLEELLNKQK